MGSEVIVESVIIRWDTAGLKGLTPNSFTYQEII
jgi:hypothetical protein